MGDADPASLSPSGRCVVIQITRNRDSGIASISLEKGNIGFAIPR
ncbi:MAG: hypothetical protein OJF55_002084 [Rhodanobacteraceae bacterium]|nr:MAG: hypothetical protein OJF55_002084 [Rhodanobacteraceae bacterium]